MVNVSQWTECWRIYYGGDSVKTLLPLYPKLIANMNVLIYSGMSSAQQVLPKAPIRLLLIAAVCSPRALAPR